MDKLQILKGAQFAAEAKRRGLSLDEAVEIALAEMPAEVGDLRTVPNVEVQYGELGNQDELQNFGGLDRNKRIKNIEKQLTEREKAKEKKDPNEITRTFFEKGKEGPQRETIYLADGTPMPERFKDAAKYRDFGLARTDVAAPARQVLQSALDDVNLGINTYGSEAFGSVPAPQRGVGPDAGLLSQDSRNPQGKAYTPESVTLASVAGRLEDDIRPNSDAEQALVREMVNRDRSNPIAREANNRRAAEEASQIGYSLFASDARGGSRADRALADIGTIGKLGKALVRMPNDLQIQTTPPIGSAYPSALPINLVAENYNSPITDNRFAGPLQKQDQFIVDNAPGYRAGKIIGDFPQVSINAQLDAARAALGKVRYNDQGIDFSDGLIRNAADLQAAADELIALGRQEGATFYRREDGKNVRVENPGIREILERGGMNQREVGNVAAALFQLEAARKNPLNQLNKNFYNVGLGQVDRPVEFGGDHPALGGGVEIARLRGEKVEGKEVKAQLQALTGKEGNPDRPLSKSELDLARMPFIGAVAGEGAPRAEFVKGEARMLTPEALVAKYGAANAAIAEKLIQRREQQAGKGADGFGFRRPNVTEVPYGRQDLDGARRVAIPSNYRPADPTERRDSFGQRRIGDDIKNTLAELNSGAYQGPTRPLTDELRGELAALGGGSGSGGGGRRTTGGYMSSPDGPNDRPNNTGYMTKPDGPNDQPRRERFIDSIVGGVRNAPKNFRRARPRTQAAAAAGGALLGAVGLDALISDETERRQEVYR